MHQIEDQMVQLYISQQAQFNLLNLGKLDKGLSHHRLVHFIQLAFGKSFVIGISNSKLQHYSRKQLLGELDFSVIGRYAEATVMVNDKKVVSICSDSLRERQNQIVIWDLETHKRKTFKFQRQLKNIIHTYFFSETKFICIVEEQTIATKSRCKSYRFKFNYLKQPFEKSFFSISLNLNEKSDLKTVKLNNKSMIGIISNALSNSDTVFIIIYSFEEQQNGWRSFQLNPEVEIPEICSIKIIDIYEILSQKLYLRIGVQPDKNKLQDRLLDEESLLKQYERSLDFMWDYKNKSVKRLNFRTQGPHQIQFINEFRPMHAWVYQKQYIQAARQLRRTTMKKGDFQSICFGTADSQYEEWEREQNQKEQVKIIYLEPNCSQIKGTEVKDVPIIRHLQLPRKNWIKKVPVDYNPMSFIEFYEDIVKPRLFIKLKKAK